MVRAGHKERAAGSGYRRKNFMAPGDVGSFFERGGNGTIFFFAELDGTLNGRFIELAPKAEEDFELGVDTRRVGRTFAGADDFESVKLLALFFEDDNDVGSGARTESHEKKLHWRGRSEVIRIEGHGMARRADGDELLFTDPLDCCSLHVESPVHWRIARRRREGMQSAEAEEARVGKATAG